MPLKSTLFYTVTVGEGLVHTEKQVCGYELLALVLYTSIRVTIFESSAHMQGITYTQLIMLYGNKATQRVH